MNFTDLKLKDYNYCLKKENIALYPEENRENSRLLIFKNGKIKNNKFKNIINFLPKRLSIVG